MNYPKPWKSHAEQLDQLIGRGMTVTDRARAIDYLERIGYYRLSGYWYAFRERGLPSPHAGGPGKGKADRQVLDSFRAGTRFQDAVDLYVFDKKLRLLALDALERVEVALRADVSHTLGEIDRFAYLRPDLFHTEFSATLDDKSGVTPHHDWLGKHARLIVRSREEFVRHNKAKYGLPLAIWVACEVWDFGTLSILFKGLREAEQDAIARQYGVSNGRVFAAWLRSLNYLRNVCAHHSRLWNRNIVEQPKLPPSSALAWVKPFENDGHARARCFLLLRITRHLLSIVNPRSRWPERMKEHLLAFPALAHLGLNLQGMGAPVDWDKDW